MCSIRLGPTALAAQSILLVSAASTNQAPFALGVATAVRLAFFFSYIVQLDPIAVTFLFQELEIFSERKMLDVHVWHQIRPS